MPPAESDLHNNQQPIPLRNLGRIQDIVDLDNYESEDHTNGRDVRSAEAHYNGGQPRLEGRNIWDGRSSSKKITTERDATLTENDASKNSGVGLLVSKPGGNNVSGPMAEQALRKLGSIPKIQTSDDLETSTIASMNDDGQLIQEDSYSDTANLTNPRNIQPISGANSVNPSRGRRRTNHGIHFLTPNWNSMYNTSGNEPSNIEAGLNGSTDAESRRSHSRDRSPSLAMGESTLLRAGTVMRKMSQRIVNLSNESELVEKSIRRKSSEGTNIRGDIEPIPSLPSKKVVFPDLEPHTRKEKQVEHEVTVVLDEGPEVDANPFRGKSLGIFGPDNRLRLMLSNLLVHPATEPVIFLFIILQTIFLSVDSAPDVFKDPRSKTWGSSWIDYALLALFCLYTVEIAARIIVSGFIINPVEYSTTNRKAGVFQAVKDKLYTSFITKQHSSVRNNATFCDAQQPSLLRSFTSQGQNIKYADSKQQQRERLAHRAFLRHSFNRLDFVAVVSFWISFNLAISDVETSKHIFVFRMLSCLRILRLLGLTSGTSIILRSLKKATPLLVNVAFLIGFFWLLFAIVGVQSFKSSLRRTCVWVDPLGVQPNFTNNAVDNFQFCGGHIGQNGNSLPWITGDGKNGTFVHKGYLCPVGSFCVEGENPYNGTVNFDNALQSLELVFVVMSSNSFSDLLYYLTDSDYLAAALCEFLFKIGR